MKANFSQTCKTNVISYKKQGNPYMKTSSLSGSLPDAMPRSYQGDYGPAVVVNETGSCSV